MKAKIGLAQINPTLGDLQRNLEIHRDFIDRGHRSSVDLLIFPELSLTGYFLKDMVPQVALRLDSPVVRELEEMSRGISLVIGLVEESEEALFYNAALYLEDGAIRHCHRKVYLPTYGLFDEQRYLARGRTVRTFKSRFGQMAILICEDLWHVSTVYLAAQQGADLLLIPAASPGRGAERGGKLEIAETWEAMNRTYATLFTMGVCFTNRVGYEDGVNFWGGSEIISPAGERLLKGNDFEENLLVGVFDLDEVRRSRISNTVRRDEDLDLTFRELQRIYRKHFPEGDGDE
ncbi:MAG: carbon-nitrogen hydrolase [Candidatus Tectomicrobia bacterium]|uniref:Carbon-nitrogen hydrolase n=1 Tax=Tectimicrobiota bacterium TaxID=2528274 RepID=A0A932GPC4_UNCTE|nr:carbon-nitrogen hydrolase [Candidatus Tectomicrobia bacterium]